MGGNAVSGTGGTIFGPGEAITTVDGNVSTFGPYVQSAPLGTTTNAATGALSADGVLKSSIEIVGGQGVLTWLAQDNPVVLKFRTAPAGALNVDASWGPEEVVDTVGETSANLETANGPSGMFAIYGDYATGDLRLRRWNGSIFGPATVVARNALFADISEDPSGGLHVTWIDSEDGAGPIMYRHSADGNTWDPPVAIADGSPVSVGIGVNRSGEGVLSYNEAGPDGNQVSFARIPPAPVLGESVDITPLKGVVATKCKGQKKFTRLRAARSIPVGCIVDTTRGTIELTSAKNRTKTQTARFFDGTFVVRQKKSKSPDTVLELTAPRCGRSGKRLPPGIAGSVLAPRGRRGGNGLWGSGKGNYTTTGKSGSGSVRGTIWFVEDRCDGSTFFRVKSGVVEVRDFVEKRTISLRAGQTYLAN